VRFRTGIEIACSVAVVSKRGRGEAMQSFSRTVFGAERRRRNVGCMFFTGCSLRMVVLLTPSSRFNSEDSPAAFTPTRAGTIPVDAENVGTYRGPARDFAQLCRAFALVHDRYLELGYMAQHESGMRYSLLNFLPQATTFVVEEGAKVLGTLTVVIDSSAGLPGSAAYEDEFNLRRAEGRILAEATMFSCVADKQKQAHVSLQLMALAFSWCAEVGVDDLCLIVAPKHAGFYEKILGFERLGRERPVKHVEGNAGILLLCNVAAVLSGEGQITRQGARLLLAAQELGTLAFNRINLRDVEVATLLDFCPELLLNADPVQREAVERHYPLACAHVENSYGAEVTLEGLL